MHTALQSSFKLFQSKFEKDNVAK